MSEPNKPANGQPAAIHREFFPTIKVLNAAEGLVEYVASDESVDSGREVILASGWKFDRLAKNPIFVDSHNYWSVGSALGRVMSWRVDAAKRQLVEIVKWAIDVKENALAQLGFSMTEKGYLRACSIGAVVLRDAWHDDDDFAAALSGTRLNEAEKLAVRRVIVEQDQYELSACVVGANPNALSRAFHDGAVPESLMARCGFDDQGLEMLEVAAKVCADERMDATMKAAAQLNVAALMLRGTRTAGRNFSDMQRPGGHAAGHTGKGRGAPAGDGSERARDQDEAWKKAALKALESVK